MNRRNFLIKTAAGGLGLAFGGFTKLAENIVGAQTLSNTKSRGFGALEPTAALNTGEVHLTLPKGFQYKTLGNIGKTMSDGRITPRAHDGMACFRNNNEWRLIRNHEINDRIPKPGVAIGAGFHYDEAAGGGTTTLVIDPKTHEIVRDFVSLSGTLNNCAGGATPWGSWISCEETTYGPTKYTAADGREAGGFARPHGYCFEVRASADHALTPQPLTAMGRFVHEAVAFDEKRGLVYLTEDVDAAGFYRFIPNRHKQLEKGGKLQILALNEKANFDTRSGQKKGVKFRTKWLTIDDPNPAEADTDPSAVFKQGIRKGAALFARLEGCFADTAVSILLRQAVAITKADKFGSMNRTGKTTDS
jgi:secreted PhoX family phosphatase